MQLKSTILVLFDYFFLKKQIGVKRDCACAVPGLPVSFTVDQLTCRSDDG